MWLLLSNKKFPWLTGLQQYLVAMADDAEEALPKILVFVARREAEIFKVMLKLEVVASLCVDGL